MNAQTTTAMIRINLADFAIATMKTLIVVMAILSGVLTVNHLT